MPENQLISSSRICEKCHIDLGNRNSNFCKKCYYKEHHEKNYVRLESACSLCGKISKLGHKKYCADCKNKIPNKCTDCGNEFVAKAKYKRCSKCQYHWYKQNRPEGFAEAYKKRKAKVNAQLRIHQGLPADHIFHKGPRGEGYLNRKGYRLMVMKHPSGKGHVRKYQHVLVMEAHLGRTLTKDERGHHKNGIRDDNHIENLELWTKSHPYGQRVEDKICWCIEFLGLYGYDCRPVFPKNESAESKKSSLCPARSFQIFSDFFLDKL